MHALAKRTADADRGTIEVRDDISTVAYPVPQLGYQHVLASAGSRIVTLPALEQLAGGRLGVIFK